MPGRALLLAAIASLGLTSGCATGKSEKPAICDGKHRRPANLYGSVLPTIPLPGQPATPPPPSTPAPDAAKPSAKQAPSPGPLSRLDPRAFAPCGRRA